MMAARASLSLFLAILSATVTVGEGQSDDTYQSGHPSFPDCPCLSREQVATVLGPALDGECIRTVSLPGVCLPPDYGQGGCQAWDAGKYAGCTGASSANWCMLQWCFVDPGNCTRPNHPSDFLPSAPLHYSYETCGDVDTYQQRVVADVIANTTVRVSYPSDGSWALVTLPDGSKAGAYHDLFTSITVKWNITMAEVPIPEISLSKFDSDYTACIHAIAINSTDVCIGSFWVTVERTTMLEFPHGVYHDQFYLATRMYASQMTFAEMITRPFLPFHWQLWLVIVASLVVVAVLYAWVEGQPSEDTPPNSEAHWISQAPDAVNESFVGFFTAAPLFAPVTAPGKIIVTGFAFLILVLVTSYTASLTAFFTRSDPIVQYVDLEDAMKQRAKICVFESVRVPLVSTYPKLKKLYVTAEEYAQEGENMMDLIDRGVCDAAIMAENDFEFIHNQHCDKALVGQPVFLMTCSLAVSPAINQAISSEMVKIAMLGEWSEIVQANKEQFMEEPSCAPPSDSDSPALGLREMAGVLIIFALMLLGAIVVQIVLMSMKTKSAYAVISTASILMSRASESMGASPRKTASTGLENGFKHSPASSHSGGGVQA